MVRKDKTQKVKSNRLCRFHAIRSLLQTDDSPFEAFWVFVLLFTAYSPLVHLRSVGDYRNFFLICRLTSGQSALLSTGFLEGLLNQVSNRPLFVVNTHGLHLYRDNENEMPNCRQIELSLCFWNCIFFCKCLQNESLGWTRKARKVQNVRINILTKRISYEMKRTIACANWVHPRSQIITPINKRKPNHTNRKISY